MLQKFGHIIWAWGTTILFAGVIYWIATIPNFDVTSDATNEVVKVVFKMLLYALFFVLFYRSIIATLKNTVQRLSGWRSKGEAVEDAEFVLIIETMTVITTILSTTLFAIFEEYSQNFVNGRQAEVKDVLVSIMAILLTALVVYTMPVIGELEVAIQHKFIKRHKANK
jgi:hypothetical protein